MFAASQTFVLTSTRSRPACIHTFFTLQTWTHACNSIPQQVVYQVLGSENVAQKGSADPQLEFPPSYRRTTSDVRVKTFSKLLQDEGVRGLYVLMDCTFPLAPVVRRRTSELEGFWNCCRMKELGVCTYTWTALSPSHLSYVGGCPSWKGSQTAAGWSKGSVCLYVLMDCTFPLAPVVRRQTSELEGFSNCCRMKE
jgi:hypothetical protein